MAASLHDIVSRRAALERRIERERTQLGEALEALSPLASVADRAAPVVNRAIVVAKFIHERPLLGLLFGSATGILLRRRVTRWLPLASIAALVARIARGMLRR